MTVNVEDGATLSNHVKVVQMFLLLGTKIFVQFAQKTNIKLSILLLFFSRNLCIIEIEKRLTFDTNCGKISNRNEFVTNKGCYRIADG